MKKMSLVFAVVVAAFFVGCGGEPATTGGEASAPESMVKEEPAAPAKDLGVGPIKSVTLGETVDEALAKTGMEVFEAKCTACHKMGKRFVGPDLAGVTDRREPEWIMNMILNPEGMVAENEAAKALLAEYLSPMANQSLTEDEARSILEYFRTVK
jgi:mono/diheme cytochrome c family protein